MNNILTLKKKSKPKNFCTLSVRIEDVVFKKFKLRFTNGYQEVIRAFIIGVVNDEIKIKLEENE